MGSPAQRPGLWDTKGCAPREQPGHTKQIIQQCFNYITQKGLTIDLTINCSQVALQDKNFGSSAHIHALGSSGGCDFTTALIWNFLCNTAMLQTLFDTFSRKIEWIL